MGLHRSDERGTLDHRLLRLGILNRRLPQDRRQHVKRCFCLLREGGLGHLHVVRRNRRMRQLLALARNVLAVSTNGLQVALRDHPLTEQARIAAASESL
jgi:hypothetical protein